MVLVISGATCRRIFLVGTRDPSHMPSRADARRLLLAALVSRSEALQLGSTRPPSRALCASSTVRWPRAIMMADGGEGSTDWSDAMRKLQARTDAMPEALRDSESEDVVSDPDAPTTQPDAPKPFPPFAAASAPPTDMPVAPPPTAGTAGGFRFERAAPKSDNNDIVAGLDKRDSALLRNAYLYGGRFLTAITITSLCFYIYVGLSGGITDGFDRFSEPIEDIRETMAREGTDPIPLQRY